MIQLYPSSLRAFLLFVFLIALSSCSKFDKEEPIPSYISIASIELVIPDSLKSKQGSASAKISDAWIFIDDKLQGIYELPATFPVLAQGNVRVKIKPGVIQNGIGSTRPIYPFYDEYTENATLIPEQVTSFKPTVRYLPYTKFVWMENFESAAISLVKTSNSDTTFKSITDTNLVFEGQKSMGIFVDDAHPVFECKSNAAFVLNTNGLPVFLELNYKTNTPIEIGLIANNPAAIITIPALTLNATKDNNNSLYWNKIYINLTDFLGDNFQATNFNVYFRVEKPSGNGISEVYLDNIKLIQ